MLWRWIKAVVALPFNVLAAAPAIILAVVDYHWAPNETYLMIIGAALLLAGLFFAGWTMRLFARKGEGTAAPWDPPQKLVVAGPYCYVRNPMITSVLIMLIAESLLLNSWHIFIWFLVFGAINLIYFPFFEEKDLEERFGADYLRYRRNVPRWIPRLTAWRQK
jgi:protein-S-isoprenylcysteine O-methyltransferase Ste14